ncbi:dihydrolipoamide acetyltransferase family protein [Kyrpidia spormannii]|uniref:Dihydrolipoamide acetyltransferase component of pyruvate dehydrogenase complex n=1 Tax=Kyrpidia spormannii TaxID=2055160 RepID=A0A6F9ED19_9BACL|nr:dihydrolipoamide acetyltransferase family protein [Kyrpidia spormannii]CAB3394775.1 Dihydrolipoamide acetyltransferase component of pyruvate dehydrogenase complex [Kyrpidia spormannii]
MEVRMTKTSEEGYDSVVVFWHVQEGASVKAGDVLVEVQTEKAVSEVTAPVDGVVTKILKRRGETVAVGEVLAVVDEAASAGETGMAPSFSGTAEAPVPPEKVQEKPEPSFVPASPRVRRLARELGVDLAAIAGTGPGGRPTQDDVRRAAAVGREEGPDGAPDTGHRAPTVADAERVQERQVAIGEAVSSSSRLAQGPGWGVRRTIARRMMQSLQGSAQLTEMAWADITRLMEWRKRWAPEASLNDWVLRAVVLALRDHPDINAHWTEDGPARQSRVNLGVAVDTDQGLLVPVIVDADRLTLEELHREAARLAEKARAGRLTHQEMTGGTFTVSNLGTYGVQFFTPILNPPEVGLLGVGRAEPYLVLSDQGIVQRQRLPLSLTFDHRAVDGGPAAQFLSAVCEALGQPERLVA